MRGMSVMQVTGDKVVGVVGVRDGLVAAGSAVRVTGFVTAARVRLRAGCRVLTRYVERVLVNVSGVIEVQMPVVKVIDMVRVADL